MKSLLFLLFFSSLFVGCASPSRDQTMAQVKAIQDITHKKQNLSVVTASLTLNSAKRWVQEGRIDEEQNGLTILEYALTGKREDVVSYVISQGANVNRVNKYGSNPIGMAINVQSIPMVKLLVSKGADLHFTDKFGNKAIHYATNSIEMVKFLMAQKFSPNEKNSAGQTPLIMAKMGKEGVIKAKQSYPQYAAAYDNVIKKYEEVITFLERQDPTLKYFEQAKAQNSTKAYKDFIATYPNSSYIGEAEDALSVIAFEKIAVPSKERYMAFLKAYPKSSKRQEIQSYITRIDNAKAQEAFDKIKAKRNVAQYQAFIKKYPFSDASNEARAFLVDIEYEKVVKTDTRSAYETFQREYPNSKYEPSIKERFVYFEQKEIIDTIAEYMQKKDIDGMITYVNSSEEVRRVAFSVPKIALLFTGPKELLVIKVLHHKKQGLGDAILSSKIRSIKKPYKNFTLDEITLLKKQGLSEPILAAMLDATSAHEDRIQREKAEARLIAKQEAIAKGMQASQKEALEKMQAQNEADRKEREQAMQQQSSGQSVGGALGDAIIKKGTEKLAGKLWDSLF